MSAIDPRDHQAVQALLARANRAVADDPECAVGVLLDVLEIATRQAQSLLGAERLLTAIEQTVDRHYPSRAAARDLAEAVELAIHRGKS